MIFLTLHVPTIAALLGLIILMITGCSDAVSATQRASNTSSVTPIDNTIEPDRQLDSTATPTPVTPTPTPTATQTATPEPSPTATLTLTPSPSPTPLPSLRQLTEGGCCVQPFFSPNGRRALFIDKPAPDAPVGIYGVDLNDPQPTPELVEETVGFRSADRTIVATVEGQLIRFTNETTGQSWTVNTGGNWPRFAPDNSQILWEARDQEGPYDRRRSDIWLADLDGSNPRLLTSVVGGGFTGWLPDSRQILLIDRDNLDEEDRTLLLYDLANDRRTDLAREKRLRGIEVSPGGRWIAYFLTFADDPEKDGIWVVSTDGTRRIKLDIPFGAYRWRSDRTLFYIPLRESPQESMQLWEVDVESSQSRPITNPDTLQFSISNGDWEVSPDGQYIIFVNSLDQNIWLITQIP